MINAGYSSMHESSTTPKNYYKVEKYNDMITDIYIDKQNHSLSSRLKKALDNSYKKKGHDQRILIFSRKVSSSA